MGYENFDAAVIERDFNNFLMENKLSPTTHAIYINVVGGFLPEEGPDRGSVNALKFSILMRQAGLKFIEGAKIDLNGNKLLKPNQIVLRITLAQ